MKKNLFIVAMTIVLTYISIFLTACVQGSHASEDTKNSDLTTLSEEEPVPSDTPAAEEIKADSAGDYLRMQQISFSDVQIKDELLSVDLKSRGTDYCTAEDVKATWNIYEAVREKKIPEKVKDVQIRVINSSGTVISDSTLRDVSKSAGEYSRGNSGKKSPDPEEILRKVEKRMAECSYEIEQEDLEKTADQKAYKIKLTLIRKGFPNEYSFISIRNLYDEMTEWYHASGEIACCEITVLDGHGDEVIFLGGDFRYGSCTAWMDDKAAHDFAEQYGPPSE